MEYMSALHPLNPKAHPPNLNLRNDSSGGPPPDEPMAAQSLKHLTLKGHPGLSSVA